MIQAALTYLVNTLRETGAIDKSECFFDATFASAEGADDSIGPMKRGKGGTIIVIADRNDLPLAVTMHAAHHHRVTLPKLIFDFNMIEAHRSNRQKTKTEDGRRLRRYERRWILERFSAWLQRPRGSNQRLVSAHYARSDLLIF